MIRKFHVFGDSWARGDGVSSLKTFSWRIFKYLGLENHQYGNHGLSGNSNKVIRDQILSTEFKKDDFILVVWTTPHRDDANELLSREEYFKNNGIVNLKHFPQYIKDVEKHLKGNNYKMTQCFNPIFGYDYKLEVDVDGSNFIEWGKPNNTLLDILTENWCNNNNRNYWMNDKVKQNERFKDRFQIDKHHPSGLGNKIIADKLLTYIDMRKDHVSS